MSEVGLSVIEGVASGVTPFVEASKANIGLIFQRERGIPRQLTKITSIQEDELRFGGILADTFGAICTRNLFNNAGRFGVFYQGVRIINEDLSATASGTLTDGAANTQTFTQTEVQEEGVGVPNIIRLFPANVSEGDTFSITLGGTTVSFVAEVSGDNSAVVVGLVAAIEQEISDTPAGTFATNIDSVVASSTYLTVTGIDNTALVFTLATVNGGANDIMIFHAGQNGQKDPGTWGNNLIGKVYPIGHVNGLVGKYLAEIYYKGLLVESFAGTTWANLITDINAQSNYFFAEPVSENSLLHSITDIQTVTLSGGVYVAPEEADYYPVISSGQKYGLNVFDGADIQLIACPDLQTDTMAVVGRDYCALYGKSLYIHVNPFLADDTDLETTSNLLQEDGPSFIAVYNIWAKTVGADGNFTWVPALGHILGAGFIRVPGLQRNHIWIPPAGVESAFRDCIDISPSNLTSPTVTLYVQRYTTNVAVFRKGKGFFLYSSRTMATNPLYHSIHIRRMTSWVVNTLVDNLEFTVQRPNTPELRRDIIVAVSGFFREIYSQGGLERTVPLDVAFGVICDVTNNPYNQNRKILNVDIAWIPVEATEEVRFRLNRNDGILIARALETNV